MKLLPLPKSGKIAKPGVYSLTMEQYHSDICVGPSISSSGLRTIEMRTPAHYWHDSYLNPNAPPRERADHFSIGQAAHTLLLGETDFKKRYAIRPEEWKDWKTNAAKAWRDDQEAHGRTVLVQADVDAIAGMARSLGAHPLYRAGILKGQVEASIVWQDERTGVWLKVRPDVLPLADGMVVDLKTTTDASPATTQRASENLGYPMQGALIGMGLKQVLGIDMTEFALVWAEKDPPHAIAVELIDANWLWYSARRVRRAIDTFAACLKAKSWPAYADERTAFQPSWAESRLKNEAEQGLLPEI